ncbi:hypothetical protein TeGR_g8044 [Tetraparma gracilis]|uniref:Uncharacterized protein n=1 Tax=Tetraparma gracilis TaxID=2962635 RepID=A0ABQ6M3P4_9STRA|nr:hypothetical protein TeGR_g8044 [Tetraparma gracilis]
MANRMAANGFAGGLEIPTGGVGGPRSRNSAGSLESQSASSVGDGSVSSTQVSPRTGLPTVDENKPAPLSEDLIEKLNRMEQGLGDKPEPVDFDKLNKLKPIDLSKRPRVISGPPAVGSNMMLGPGGSWKEMPEGAADLVFTVLWDQLATPDKGERSEAVDGYLGVGEILKSDGLKYRTFSDAVITLLPGRKKRRGGEGGWDMRLRPMEGAEMEAIRGDKYERVFEKLEGKGGLGLGVREVPELLMPEDFTETELVMFLDGVVRNLD